MVSTQSVYGDDDQIAHLFKPAKDVDETAIECRTFDPISRTSRIASHSFFNAAFENGIFNVPAFQVIHPHFFFGMAGEKICPIDDLLPDVLDSWHLWDVSVKMLISEESSQEVVLVKLSEEQQVDPGSGGASCRRACCCSNEYKSLINQVFIRCLISVFPGSLRVAGR